MRFLSLVALALLTATPLAAQRRPADPFGPRTATVAQRALHGSSGSILTAPVADDRAYTARMSAPSRGSSFGIRLLTGAVGAGVGVVAGGVAGYHLLPRRDCGDDPGLCEAAVGAAIGAVAGAALGAALPRAGSACAFDRRLGTGLLGGAAGGLVGLLVSPRRGSTVVYLVPLGTTIGAAIGAEQC